MLLYGLFRRRRTVVVHNILSEQSISARLDELLCWQPPPTGREEHLLQLKPENDLLACNGEPARYLTQPK